MPRTIGDATPSVRSVLWYSQMRRSPVRVITAIKPRDSPTLATRLR
jgi:hypothetical protein